MATHQALIIADDLTGAADTGAQFARAGWRTLLTLEPGSPQEADVHVLTSESRGMADGVEADRAVSKMLAASSAHAFPLIYKKIDSTLRGHPAAELAAAMRVLGEARALIAPAFPAQGRTTLDGRVRVNGLPLEETSFSSEVPSGDLRRIFGAGAALLTLETVRGEPARLRAALREAQRLTIADAETEDDLLRLARAALAESLRLWCGSAGLAGALATCLGASTETPPPPPHPAGHFLAVAGSRHAATEAQVSAARRAGAVVVRPPEGFFTAPHPPGVAACAARLADALGKGQHAILAVGSPADAADQPDSMYDQKANGYAHLKDVIPPTEIAARLAHTTALALEKTLPAGLLLTGGETARAVCRALGCTQLWLGGEVEPGMPWSRMADGRFPGLLVVTKAGGFGGEESLVHALRFFD